MIAQIVRFRSELPDEQVLETYKARAPRYRALKGLRQKYYLRFAKTGEYGAVYLWDSATAIKEFHESELGQTIATAYQIQEVADVRVADVVMTLRPEAVHVGE